MSDTYEFLKAQVDRMKARDDGIPACPICRRAPRIEKVEPWWERKYGPAPWYAVCYNLEPREHFVGGTADTREDAIKMWKRECAATAT